MNGRLSPPETRILQSLDQAVHSPDVRARLDPVINRVQTELTRRQEAVMTWEPIPLSVFDVKLPQEIKSAWIFILRAGSNTGAERHPNSHQRMMSFAGNGDLQTRRAMDQPWESNFLISDPTASLDKRWVSIPQNVWHQPVIPPGRDWVVVSFHTVEASELIEERPDSEAEGTTSQMRYLG